MERALSLLTCGYDPARKNVALFFGAAIHFRGILDVFDRVGGLPRLLDAMRTVLLLLHAPVHGENRAEKQASPLFWRSPTLTGNIEHLGNCGCCRTLAFAWILCQLQGYWPLVALLTPPYEQSQYC